MIGRILHPFPTEGVPAMRGRNIAWTVAIALGVVVAFDAYKAKKA